MDMQQERLGRHWKRKRKSSGGPQTGATAKSSQQIQPNRSQAANLSHKIMATRTQARRQDLQNICKSSRELHAKLVDSIGVIDGIRTASGGKKSREGRWKSQEARRPTTGEKKRPSRGQQLAAQEANHYQALVSAVDDAPKTNRQQVNSELAHQEFKYCSASSGKLRRIDNSSSDNERGIIKNPRETGEQILTPTGELKSRPRISLNCRQPECAARVIQSTAASHGHLSLFKSAPLLERSSMSLFGARFAVLMSALCLVLAPQLTPHHSAWAQSNAIQMDPRPTIYSGQVSFGLLLSAHSSSGAELATAASSQHSQVIAAATTTLESSRHLEEADKLPTSPAGETVQRQQSSAPTTWSSLIEGGDEPLVANSSASLQDQHALEPRRSKRQIFENNHYQTMRRQRQEQQQQQQLQLQQKAKHEQHPVCNQVNLNALYAGMGAIWASHQANLVGDSQLTIGTYIYDSCSDQDVGQRQSVRIVSNLNAFQQTTCESPRGSPISITIAHGDNHLSAIQLLTSFRVPVITTKEHFALEDFHQLTKEQRKFLFSTAPSSRHLAAGALKFTRRVVARLRSSQKLANRHHGQSPKNGLVVISRSLPPRFIAHLTETIPSIVNYEMLQTSQPIDQIRSVESLESILINKSPSSAATGSGGAQHASSGQESQLLPFKVSAPPLPAPQPSIERRRMKRMNDDSDSSGGDSEGDDSGADQQQRMLSPTILMFITPAEVIDLVTRLRTDLAEVSKYYSLIVTTREDISPALKTIFLRGDSRLCSGKAFYTISPISEDISEFSRYFSDTVHAEGEMSDHPLIIEYAKHRSMRSRQEPDEMGTESVIKAVWSAAAAFKSVYRSHCGQEMNSNPMFSSSSFYNSAGGDSTTSSPSGGESDGQRPSATSSAKHGRQSNGNKPADCVAKMNKNMSNSVQKAMKRLSVTINSTGLAALDGFTIRYNEHNELMTNKFSIKYVNKECEIVEIGQFTGQDLPLRLDEGLLTKSLDNTVPDPWPISVPPPTPAPVATSSAASSSTNPSSSTTDGDSASAGNSPSDSSSTSGASDDANSDSAGGSSTGDSEKMPTGSFETVQASEPQKKRRPSGNFLASKSADGHPKRRTKSSKFDGEHGARKQTVTPIRAMRGRGMADAPAASDGNVRQEEPTSAMVNSTAATSDSKKMRTLKPFPAGVSVRDWLPKSGPSERDVAATTTESSEVVEAEGEEESDAKRTSDDETTRAGPSSTSTTTQAPVYSTLPESGGNTDLDMPAFRSGSSSTSARPVSAGPFTARSLDVSATTTLEMADYVTSPSIRSEQTPFAELRELPPVAMNHSQPTRINYLQDLFISPIPFASPAPTLESNQEASTLRFASPLNRAQQRSTGQADLATDRPSRSKLRSHLKWIYSSWFTLSILGANICGALFTLYVLTFLLMKNCNGTLDRENQGIRSMHLLAIIVVFFGSTLFIVYPTPGLCLLRTSWHNFALVLLFGSLLLQTMQIRSMNSLGLGGRPNRLNQFLTLLFMVGVQVSFELQRWRYESANYVNFVNQYFGSSENGDRKLMIFSSAMAANFNPLNSFNDQLSPVSIQVSEKYQSLLQDYCSQPAADTFLQSQIYLWMIICLLLVFSLTTRRQSNNCLASSGATCSSSSLSPKQHPKLTSTLLTGGKLLATQHETNYNMSPCQFKFSSNVAGGNGVAMSAAAQGNVFLVTVICVPIYFASIMLHVNGQSLTNHDLISSITMVLIAFTALLGLFLPILHHIQHRFDGLIAHRQTTTIQDFHQPSVMPSDQMMGQANLSPKRALAKRNNRPQSSGKPSRGHSPGGQSSVFTMFPEFAPTGLRRPASLSGDSSSGAGSRRPFAETKESRKNMSIALANLGPSMDSLKRMGMVYNPQQKHNQFQQQVPKLDPNHAIDPGLLNLKLNLNVDDEMSPIVDHDLYRLQHQHNRPHQNVVSRKSSSSNGGGEQKRLIMLDVDPHCPRHGVAAWPDQARMPDTNKDSNEHQSGRQEHHHHYHSHHQ